MNDQQALVLALEDQSWMAIEESLEDIKRLAETGLPATQRDVLVIRQALCVVAAGICQRKATRIDDG